MKKNGKANVFELAKLGKYFEALKAFEKDIEINLKSELAWVGKGMCLTNLLRYAEAIYAFEKAIEINLKSELAWVGKGNCLNILKRHEEAIEAFEKAIEINPKSEIAWNNLGIALIFFEGHEKAIEVFEKANEINPKSEIAWNNLGIALGKFERYKEAIEVFEKAIEINPKSELAYCSLGEIYLFLGNLEDASKNIKDALNINENFVPALTVQGRINIEEKDYDTAIKSFKRAISLDIGNPKHFLWDAYASYLKIKFSLKEKSMKYKEEIVKITRNLERANSITEKHEKEMKLYILYFLACFYLKSDDAFTAKEKLEECIKLQSKSTIEVSARELLNNIWNYKIRPPWWRWWLKSPLSPWPKRIVFFILAMFILVIFASLLLHPFVSWCFFSLQINWNLYGFLIAILIFVLISPSIEHIKARDIELVMCQPPPFETFFSPMVMEERIKQLELNIIN